MWILIGIFILSISLRLICLQQISITPIFGFFAIDSWYYDEFASKILNGNFVFKESIYLSPLYPLILAGIYKILGHNLIIAMLFQVITDSLTCVFLYFICIKIFNKKSIGLLASFIYACYGMAIFYTCFLLESAYATFLLVSLFLLLLYANDKKKPQLWIFSGVIFGLAILLRPNVILFFPFLTLLFCSCTKKKVMTKITKLILIFIGMLIVFTPFSIRNYMMEKKLSPFPAQGGVNFYIGNHPNANGTFMHLSGIPKSPVDQIKQSVLLASKETGRILSPSEASRYWFLKGMQFIKQNPRQYFFLSLKKICLFWNSQEIAMNLNFYFCKKYIPILNSPLFYFGIISPFAVLGLIFAVRQRDKNAYLISIFITIYMFSVVLFFVTARYRFPCVPFIIIMASYGLYNLFISMKYSKIRKFIPYLIILLVLFIILNKEIFNINSKSDFVTAYNNLGVVYYKKGMKENAIVEYQKALKINPDYVEAINNLGVVYRDVGRDREASNLFRKAIEINPNFAEAYYNLGNVYGDISENEKMIFLYKKALELNPYWAEAYNSLGTAYHGIGKTEEAVISLKKAIEIKPEYAKAYNNLGVVYAENDRRGEATVLFKKAIELDPHYADAYNNLAVAYYHEREYNLAVKSLDKAIKLGKNNPALLELLELHR